MGDVVKIQTLDGEREVSIPAGIQFNETVRIKGAGVPNLSKPSLRGDHIVVVTIKTPSHISNEEKALYQKLYEIQTGRQNLSTKERIKGIFK